MAAHLRNPATARGRLWLALRALILGISIAATAGTIAVAADEAPTPKPPFGMTDTRVAAPAPESRSAVTLFFNQAWSILLFEQHKLTQEMTGAVRDIKSSTSLTTATSALVMASFVYGILHAAGPGHGKAVISSYMLADKQTLKRGVFLAFLSSFIQALSAIFLIGGLFFAAKATGLETRIAEAWLETASWGCVALLGAWLMVRQIWQMTRWRRRADDHGHGVDACQHALVPAEPFEIVHPKPHVHDEHCNHAHLPGPEDLKGAFSWKQAFALALSVGVRPCTGALLVIIFAAAQGLIWAGILATFAMAIGTALTVSALAALSVGSRNIAVSLAGKDSWWGSAIAHGASFLSSTLVFVLGSAFFVASLQQPMRPF